MKSIYLITIMSIIGVTGISSRHEMKAAEATTIITSPSSSSYIDSYYSSVNSSLTGLSLAAALETRLQNERGRTFSYDSLQTSAFPFVDPDPNRVNGGYIVSFYSGTPVSGYTGMNKEHTWPKSHGGNKIENDPHVIRPTLTAENSARGNAYYAESSSQGWDPASFGNAKYRGVSARIILYGAVIGYTEGLRLEDVGFVSGSGNGGKMGKLSDLLRWNLQYPVDTTEIIRNETLDISLNYNRNPFIDNPSYACQIWGNANATTQSICAASSIAPTSISLVPPTQTISLGHTLSLQMTVAPSNASTSVTWTSSNQAVATVNHGTVTGVGVGTVQITARSTIDTNVFGTAEVTVTNEGVDVTGVTLNVQTLSLAASQTSQLVATVTPTNATDKTVSWLSSNPAVASVSSQGLVTAHKLGTATISVTTNDGGYKATTKITVLPQGALTTTTGSLYNSTSDNNGGDGGVTKTNLNNGINDYSALGFGGTVVVDSVTSSNGYFPRSGGLAIGSSSKPGNIQLTFASNYRPTRVDLTFNDAGQGNTVSSITGSSSATVQNGTPGTAYSRPSTGTPYVVTFASATETLVIATSKRIALVEIVLYLGTPSTIGDDVNVWANDFINQTSSACSTYNAAALESLWPTLAAIYTALDSDAKMIIGNSVPNDGGHIIESALARYAYIVNKYQFNQYIDGIFLDAPTPLITREQPASLTYVVIAGLTVIFMIDIGLYFIFVKRKKEQ